MSPNYLLAFNINSAVQERTNNSRPMSGFPDFWVAASELRAEGLARIGVVTPPSQISVHRLFDNWGFNRPDFTNRGLAATPSEEISSLYSIYNDWERSSNGENANVIAPSWNRILYVSDGNFHLDAEPFRRGVVLGSIERYLVSSSRVSERLIRLKHWSDLAAVLRESADLIREGRPLYEFLGNAQLLDPESNPRPGVERE